MDASQKLIWNKISSDWFQEFPELNQKLSGIHFVKRIGPALIGIKLFKLFSKVYRPEFIISHLLDDSKDYLIDIVHQFIRGKNNIQVTIDISKHDKHYIDACELLKRQIKIDLANPSIEDIIKQIFNFLNEDYMVGTNIFEQCNAIILLSYFVVNGDKHRKKAIELLTKMSFDILNAETGGFDAWKSNILDLDRKYLEETMIRKLAK